MDGTDVQNRKVETTYLTMEEEEEEEDEENEDEAARARTE